MKISKAYYEPKTGKIKANNKLNYLHEKGHKIIEDKIRISLIQDISGFLLIFCIIFQNKMWQISAFIFFIGLQILDELFAWKYAFKHNGQNVVTTRRRKC